MPSARRPNSRIICGVAVGDTNVENTPIFMLAFLSLTPTLPANRPARQPMNVSPRTSAHESAVGVAVEHHPSDVLEMRLARLDLLRQRMDVAEASLERRAEEDCRSAGRLVGAVGDLESALDRMAAGQPYAGAVLGRQWLDVV